MTVPALPSRDDYTGDGSLATYDYGFRITSATDLLVVTRDLVDVETVLTYPADYSVTGVGDFNGGSITLTAGNLATGHRLVIRDDPPLVQTTDVRNQGTFFPEIHEDAFDYAIRAIKSVQDRLNRALTIGESEFGVSSAVPPLQPGYALFAKADGSGVEWLQLNGAGAPVSPFMAGVLDDASALEARATLGAVAAANGALSTPTLTRPKLVSPEEPTNGVTGNGTTAIDGLVASYYVVTMTGNVTTLSISNIPAAPLAFALTLEIVQAGSGGYTIAWPGTVKWPGGVPPTLTTTVGKTDVITLVTRDGAASWLGYVAGQDF